MKRIEILNEITNRPYGSTFDTQEELDAWKNKHIAKDTFGKKARTLVETDSSPVSNLDKSRATSSQEIELEPAIMSPVYELEEVPVLDENGDPVLDENGDPETAMTYKLDVNDEPIQIGEEVLVPAVTAMQYEVPADYTITETSATNGYFAPEAAFEDMRKQRDQILKETDFSQLPDAPVDSDERVNYKNYRAYLRSLPGVYTDSNVYTYNIMTFEEYKIANP